MSKKLKDIDTNLDPAINFYGNQAKLANALGIDPMAITQWKRRGIPPSRAKEIALLTKGKIKPSDLKPKLFADLPIFDDADTGNLRNDAQAN